jgi:hypothetical protein
MVDELAESVAELRGFIRNKDPLKDTSSRSLVDIRASDHEISEVDKEMTALESSMLQHLESLQESDEIKER